MGTDVFEAIVRGDLAEVQRIVAEDPSAASARNDESLPAVLAAQYRHRQDLVDVLLAAGPLLDVFEAAGVGDVARLEALIDQDPSLAGAYAADGFFPLGLAAYFGRAQAVRLLVDRGADVGAAARNSMQVQALHAAVAGRHTEVVRTLLEAGADPNARQHGGWTPLMGAAAHGDEEIVELLLAAGADLTPVNDGGSDAAALAQEHGHAGVFAHLAALAP